MSLIKRKSNSQNNSEQLALDELVKGTLADLHLFTKQQLEIKNQIQEMLEDNLKKSSTTSDVRYELKKHSQLTNDALMNTRKQIDIMLKDKQDLTEINENSYRTIKNLEMEVENYRKLLNNLDKGTEYKSKYENAIQLLEAKISQQKIQLEEQTTLIKMLHSHKIRGSETIAKLDKQLNEERKNGANDQLKDKTIKKLEHQLQSALKKNKEYEKSLNSSNKLLEETSKREAIAMRKVQESLVVAETAMQEKREAENRAKAFKEECTQLASNIGTIMDQAAQRVDGEVLRLKMKLEKKEESLNDLQRKLLKEREDFKKERNQMELEKYNLKQKYKDILNENAKLRDDAQLACEHVHSMKLKLSETEHIMMLEQCQEMQRQCEAKLESVTCANKKLKERYHLALEDLTTKFEDEMLGLKKENAELKANFQYMQSAELAKVVAELAEENSLDDANK